MRERGEGRGEGSERRGERGEVRERGEGRERRGEREGRGGEGERRGKREVRGREGGRGEGRERERGGETAVHTCGLQTHLQYDHCFSSSSSSWGP